MGPTYRFHLSLGNAGASNPKSQIGFFFFPADPHNSVGRGCVSRTVTDRALSCATPFDLLPGFHLTVPRDGTPRAFHGCWQGSAWSLTSKQGVCHAGDAWSCFHHARDLEQLIFSPDGCHRGSPSDRSWLKAQHLGAEFGHPPRAGRLQGWGCSFSRVARRFTALERLQASLGEEY